MHIYCDGIEWTNEGKGLKFIIISLCNLLLKNNYYHYYFQQTIEAWRFIFFMTLALYLVEFTVFTLWSSGEEQPWNNGPTKQKQSVDTQELPMNTAEKDS